MPKQRSPEQRGTSQPRRVMVSERRQENDRTAAFLEPKVPVAADRFEAELVGLQERPGSQFAGVHGPEYRPSLSRLAAGSSRSQAPLLAWG
jgi:hypothetical protein